jgi:hypothetical protein
MVRAAHEHRTFGVPIYAGALHRGPGKGLLSDPGRSWRSWMRGILPRIAGHYDVWSTHDYGRAPNLVDAQREELLTHDQGQVPISVNEFGRKSWRDDRESLEEQGPFLRDYLMALGERPFVSEAMQFELRDRAAGALHWHTNYGLLFADLTPKPAYEVVAHLLAAN